MSITQADCTLLQMTTADRMMALFLGHGVAHGTHGEPTNDGRKWQIKQSARKLRQPVTVEIWGQRLAGERPLGIILIREDGTCLWGSIDVDVYDDDHAATAGVRPKVWPKVQPGCGAGLGRATAASTAESAVPAHAPRGSRTWRWTAGRCEGWQGLSAAP